MRALDDLPTSWEQQAGSSLLEPGAVSLVNFLEQRVFSDYEPEQFSPFRQRLLRWLANVEDEKDQQRLLSLLLDVFYVGRKEFEALYRTTYRSSITRWLIDVHNLQPFEPNIAARIHGLANRAWICPISDSLRINAFLKVNGLKSKDKRPDWRSLHQFGDVVKIREFVKSSKINTIILLEDFVGSGTQALDAVRFAARTLPKCKILLAPLIVCPKGDRAIRDALKRYKRIRYEPTLVVPEDQVHCYERYKSGNGHEHDGFLVDLCDKLNAKKEVDAFGFKNTGAKVVLYSNCPNNTLPIFHRATDDWYPLFPRVTRQ